MPASVLHSRNERKLQPFSLLTAVLIMLGPDQAIANNATLAMNATTPITSFPDPKKATLKEGLFVTEAAVRLIAPGMTKRQISAILGAPHFHEGLIGERTWDYILNFRTGGSTDYVVCQYQLRFGPGRRLSTAVWNSELCSRIIVPPQIGQPLRKPDVEDQVQRKLTMYFDYGSDEIAPTYLNALDSLMHDAMPSFMIQIIGHTDRAGSERYNDTLSLSRARAVARALLARGVSPNRMDVSGAGENQPAVQTPDGVAEERNRRSEVVISYFNVCQDNKHE